MLKRHWQAAVIIVFIILGCRAWGIENTEATKVYLPGDVVSVIVGAPPDTAKIIAQMPDRQDIDLVYDRRNYYWQGHWEVPMRMKKGEYAAKLLATDVEGKIYEGKTGPFFIGEPTLITLINMVEKKKGRVVAPAGTKRRVEAQFASDKVVSYEGSLAVPSTQPVVPEQSVLPELLAVPEQIALVPTTTLPARAIVSPAEAPSEPVVEVAPVEKPVKKATKVPPKKKKGALFAKSAVEPDNSDERVNSIIEARYYLARKDFNRAKGTLKTLLKGDPNNPEVRKLLRRVDEIIKARESGE